MDLLIQFGYPYPYAQDSYSKFTIIYTIISPHLGEEITLTIGTAIPLTDEDNVLIPHNEIYHNVVNQVNKHSEIYDGSEIVQVTIRIFTECKKMSGPLVSLSIEDRAILLERSMDDPEVLSDGTDINQRATRKIQNRKRKYPMYIKALKPTITKLRAFIVADIETLLYMDENDEDETQYPYSAGFMVVRPGEPHNKRHIEVYYSEDYKMIMDHFPDRSTKLLSDMIRRISKVVVHEKVNTIYLHNFARFDGILLFRHLVLNHKEYEYKGLMRDNMLYEIAVYSKSSKRRRVLFRFRDSLHLLPGKLASLANNLCPELGVKGSIDHDMVSVNNLESNKKDNIAYLKQDILILGGILQKAQDIYYNMFNVDIESRLTVTSLALSIYRKQYYDDKNKAIYIPNRNQDSFIRRGYYGGHTDTYIPYGKELYYYDVNSLYPFVMKEFPMPGGKPVWHRDLTKMRLEDMFGFIEAFIICPSGMKRPFLPSRKRDDTLLFPTGKFVDVYFTEELKYAETLGYLVYPISGYLFDKMETPFKEFVSTIAESRNEARKEGNESLAYVYKILMNSLYGRFGINPKCTMTEICDDDRLSLLKRLSGFIDFYKLDDNINITKYKINIDGKHTDRWQPPSNSAIQISAAITAYARRYMYEYISRDDCYYTDTDSVVLGQPLPDELISSSVLGKFKLEHHISEGYFLAPKAYYISTKDDDHVIRYKGAGKNLVTPEWFELQLLNPSRTETKEYTNNFKIAWKTFKIFKLKTKVRLGLQLTSKRIPVFHNNKWVDTKPINVGDDKLTSVSLTGFKIIEHLLNKIQQQEEEMNQFLNLNKLLSSEDMNQFIS